MFAIRILHPSLFLARQCSISRTIETGKGDRFRDILTGFLPRPSSKLRELVNRWPTAAKRSERGDQKFHWTGKSKEHE